MLVTRSVLASIVLLISMSTSLTTLEAADTSTKVLEGVHWAGPSVTLEGLHGKTVANLLPINGNLLQRLRQG